MSVAGQSSQDELNLRSYAPSLTFSRLAPGIDNIRYDVYLSPRWRELASQVLFEQILLQAQPHLKQLKADDPRARIANLEEFKRRLGKLLLDVVARAKVQNNIEIDLLARVALYQWLTAELRKQFSEVAVVCKEHIEKKGRYQTQDEMWVFSMRSRLSEYQVNRRAIVRGAGETLFDLLEELEERSLRPERKALFGSDFAESYEVLSNRLLFLENPYDSPGHLEHYVMLGRRDGDAGHVDHSKEVLRKILTDEDLVRVDEDAHAWMGQQRRAAFDELKAVSKDLREAEKQLANFEKSKGGGGFKLSFLTRKGEQVTDPEELQGTVNSLQARQADLNNMVEELEEKLNFTRQTDYTRVDEVLSFPENAEQLFGPLDVTSQGNSYKPGQKGRRQKLFSLLEAKGLLNYILASYQIRPMYQDFCPPLSVYQLLTAMVEKSAWKKMSEVLKQHPARNFKIDKLSVVASAVRKIKFANAEPHLARFALHFMRLEHDLRNYELLTALMEKIHLIEDERSREVSRMNNSLYSVVLAEERDAGEDKVASHVIVKADIRGSTTITEQLVERGLNPATHFSQNFFEPVRDLIARYNAKKIFLEGDAFILGIFEADSSRTSRLPLAKACLLAKEIVLNTLTYNQKARANGLPELELGLGVAFQNGAPHYWSDGDSQVMISPAINLSDRLSSCSKIARMLSTEQSAAFHCYLYQGPANIYSGDDKEGTHIRYNVMGVMLSEAGFRRLEGEISLKSVTTELQMFGHSTKQRLHWGTVPIGEQYESLIIREARVPELDLSNPDEPEIAAWTEKAYFEVCVHPKLYENFPPKGK
jgi:class 3 adenylate cyclase